MICFPKEDVVRGDKIGRGSFWKVYEGKLGDTRCAIKRSIKAIAFQQIERNRVTEKVFHECTLWGSLDHSNIVKFYGVYYENEVAIEKEIPCLLMEIMDKSLSDHIKCTSSNQLVLFPLKVKGAIFIQVCEALQYLHDDQHLIHGDLVTNNVLLKEYSPGCFTAKLSDFGMARVLGESETVSTACATVFYMPPEIHNGCPGSEKVDIFSLGVLIIHTLIHKLPRPSAATIMNKGGVLSAVSEFKRYSHHLVHLGEDEKVFVPLIEDCLQYHPNNRPSAQMARDDLQRICAQEISSSVCYSSSIHGADNIFSSQVRPQVSPHPDAVYFTGPVVAGCRIDSSIINVQSNVSVYNLFICNYIGLSLIHI